VEVRVSFILHLLDFVVDLMRRLPLEQHIIGVPPLLDVSLGGHCTTCFFKLCTENGSKFTVTGLQIPGRGDDLLETSILYPEIFESKQSGLGNEGGNLNLKGNVIRGAPSEGGEERAWEHLIPG